ncbi:MAG: hypothetical protein HRT44_08085 [Bdellovibrionales bacterium]|nr:hypothetical protein [Bdellovibrionales bacterium]NQZ19197.1 hypothetical protein [Bdellovibrionales bacterium]
MKNFIFLFLILSACDSPMNHRVTRGEQDAENKEQQLYLKTMNLQVEARWLNGPHGSLQKTSSIMVMVFDTEGKLSDIGDDDILQFYASMPSMGHPLEDPGTFERLDEGIYINHKVQFNMPGDWLMEIWIMDQNFEIKDKVEWDEFL